MIPTNPNHPYCTIIWFQSTRGRHVVGALSRQCYSINPPLGDAFHPRENIQCMTCAKLHQVGWNGSHIAKIYVSNLPLQRILVYSEFVTSVSLGMTRFTSYHLYLYVSIQHCNLTQGCGLDDFMNYRSNSHQMTGNCSLSLLKHSSNNRGNH